MGVIDIAQMIFPLLLIILLLGGVWFFISRKGVKKNIAKFNPLSIDVMSVKAIMPKKYVAAVKVEDKILVIGVSDHSINLLQEKDFDADKYENPKAENVKSKFHELIKQNLPR